MGRRREWTRIGDLRGAGVPGGGGAFTTAAAVVGGEQSAEKVPMVGGRASVCSDWVDGRPKRASRAGKQTEGERKNTWVVVAALLMVGSGNERERTKGAVS